MDAAGVPTRSFFRLKQNCVLGRALSAYGSSTDLTATPINVYLTYNDATGPKTLDDTNTLQTAGPFDAISFVHHTNRIAISGMGIEVMS